MNMLGKKVERKYSRLSVYHLAKFRLASQPKGELIVASIKDIGGGGGCLIAEDNLSKGETLQLYINFPRISTPVPCLAKVVWSKKVGKTSRYEIGLQFLEIEEILRQEMVNRIDQLSASKK
jgi:c-di-GMP-binding flagellar brake protein YcgR